MEQDLAAAMGGSSGVVRAETARPASRRSGRPLLVAAAVLVAVVAGALLLRSWLAPLEVDAEWVRVTDENVEERLTPGARVEKGDALFLEIDGSRPMHVYVINYDETGAGFALFPLPGSDLVNPLEPRVKHRLPGIVMDGKPVYWEVSSATGREFMLVVASRRPVPLVEQEIARLPAAGSGSRSISQEVITTLRGIGGLTQRPGGPAQVDERLSSISDKLGAQREASGGIWVRELEVQSVEPAADKGGP